MRAMSGLIIILAYAAMFIAGAAWVTLLPSIGVLYLSGALH